MAMWKETAVKVLKWIAAAAAMLISFLTGTAI